MLIFKKKVDLAAWLHARRNEGKSIGFVPTMGALHAGHLALVEASRHENAVTVSSIFVNPTQFNDKRDFEKYPITLEKDIPLLEKAGCTAVFVPSVDEIYNGNENSQEQYDLGYLETVLEGAFRPGHFQGVCKVMRRLLTIVPADNLYMGQKDYQQCMVVKRLLVLMNSNTKLHTCPTLRENDGLAMSSRNQRLSPEARQKAPLISSTLRQLQSLVKQGENGALLAKEKSRLNNSGFRVDYLSLADAETLEPVNNWNGTQKLVALAAAFLDDVRLIDNMRLN